MKALALVVFAALAMPAFGKGRELTPAWSGIWSEASGQHRCAIDVQAAPLRARLTVLCQLGPDAVFAQLPTVPRFGEPIVLSAPNADFGMPAAGLIRWGTVYLYPVCNEGQPELIGTAYTTGAAADLRMHLVTPELAGLCKWGGQ